MIYGTKKIKYMEIQGFKKKAAIYKLKMFFIYCDFEKEKVEKMFHILPRPQKNLKSF